MPLISERTTHAGARGKSLPREENRSRRKERRARELISNTRTRVTCSLRTHDHSPHARPCLFLSVMGRGLLVLLLPQMSLVIPLFRKSVLDSCYKMIHNTLNLTNVFISGPDKRPEKGNNK